MSTGTYAIKVPSMAGAAYDELKIWLMVHGIEPSLVPADNAKAVVGGGRVRMDVFLTREGRTYRVRGDASPTARGTLTVPLLTNHPLPRCFKRIIERDLLPTGGIRT